MNAGILPVKHLDRAKARFASHLDEGQRRALAEALLADAIKLVTDADFLEWWVVSDDPTVLDLAGTQGLRTVPDDGIGLNEALTAALAPIASAGAVSVMVIPSDLPLAIADDLRDVLDTGELSDVVLIPSHDGGTNGLFLKLPASIEMHFGPNSLAAHAKAAEEAGLRCSILPLDRLSFDVDTAADIAEVLARAGDDPGATVELLGGLGPAFEIA